MDDSAQEEQSKNDKQATTFPIPLNAKEVKDNVIVNNTLDEPSKEKIITQAHKFHSEGNILEAAKYYQYFINQGFNDHRVFFNYGIILKNLGKLKEAELYIRKAISLKPLLVDAYLKLGVILSEMGNLKEAELSLRKAIELKPDFADAHSSLGTILIELSKLKEAEISLRKAIELKPNNSTAYLNLCICLYLLKDKYSALENIKIAHEISPKDKTIILLLNILQGLNSRGHTDIEVESIRSHFFKEELDSNIFISNRSVEPELIKALYSINAIDAKRINKYQQVIIGNSRGSDFNLFDNSSSIINKLKENLIYILENNLKSNIVIKDSFVTIFQSGGGVKSHSHIGKIDHILKFVRRKMSLVYYLSVGDQDCDDPGILKFYNPNKEILPKEGMIIIFPSDIKHSSFYSGTKDRIIVGINFYII